MLREFVHGLSCLQKVAQLTVQIAARDLSTCSSPSPLQRIRDLLKRGIDQFDRLYQESAENARIMAISIHPYITGVPHRIKYLEQLLDYVDGHDDVCWMTASEIGDWYRSQMDNLG